MSRRWTMKELEETDTIDFAIAVLQERYSTTTNAYSPLSQKIKKTQRELEEIKIKLKKLEE